MVGIFASVMSKFQDPEVASSFGPLIVHALVFVIVPGFFAVFFYKKFKSRPKTTVTVTNGSVSDSSHLLDEIKRLHEIIARLERECSQERETNAIALGRCAELETQSILVSGKYQEALKQLDKEHGIRLKLEDKVKRLDKQLEDAIQETEKIYQQDTTKVPDQSRERLQQVSNDHLVELRHEIEEKEAEITQLKSLLQACKLKLLELNTQKSSMAQLR